MTHTKMTTLNDLSESKLIALTAKASRESELICDKMIACGRGRELSSETMGKCDDLSLRFQASTKRMHALYSEASDRKAYHGTLKRIKRAVA